MRDRIPIPRIARDPRLIRRRMYFPIYFRGRSSRNKFRAIDKIMRSNLVDGSFTEEKRTRYGDFSAQLSSSRYLATLISSTAASFRLHDDREELDYRITGILADSSRRIIS